VIYDGDGPVFDDPTAFDYIVRQTTEDVRRALEAPAADHELLGMVIPALNRDGDCLSDLVLPMETGARAGRWCLPPLGRSIRHGRVTFRP
jgi:hypothetical protein